MTLEQQPGRTRPIRLLLVEDNHGDVLLMKRAFTKSNTPHDFIVARTGEDALRMLEEMPPEQWPDAILLDLNLPGVSGHEVLTTLKRHQDFKRIPVFVISSSYANEDVQASYAAQANCYIVKPHDLDSLCEIAERIDRFWFSSAVLPAKNLQREPSS